MTIQHELEEIAVKEAITNLSDREKRILSMRFFRGKTQMEVAAEIGISQAQVSRIEKRRSRYYKEKHLTLSAKQLFSRTAVLCLHKFMCKNHRQIS